MSDQTIDFSRADIKDIKAWQAINLIIKSISRLDKQKQKLVELGANFHKRSIPGQITRGTAIIETTGNRFANEKLTAAINLLNAEINDEFPYPKLIKFYLDLCLARLNEAMGKHFAEWEDIIKYVTVNSLSNDPGNEYRKSVKRGISLLKKYSKGDQDDY